MRMMTDNAVEISEDLDISDELRLCFDEDSNANFLIGADGTLRYCNAVGRAMLFDGLFQLDGRHRLCLTGGKGRKGRTHPALPLSGSAEAQVRQITPSRWLGVAVREIPELQGDIHIRAREIDLENEIDLGCVVQELGISDSETPVFHGIAQAVCPKEISRSLGLSIHTIRSHIRAIYAKVGVNTSAEAQLRILQVYYLINSIK